MTRGLCRHEKATNSNDITQLIRLIAPEAVYGRGTNVLVNNAGTWQMLHERLSP